MWQQKFCWLRPTTGENIFPFTTNKQTACDQEKDLIEFHNLTFLAGPYVSINSWKSCCITDNSPELDELEALSLFIEHYEDKQYPIALPSPIDAITFRLEQLGKEKSELAKILGTRARQSETLSGKRKLSLEMIRKLHAVLGIPAESLISAY